MADIIIVATEGSVETVVDNHKSTSNNPIGDSNKIEPGVICQVDLGSGNTKCCVPNCSSNSLGSITNSQVSFITFPRDPSRFTEWTRAIQRPDLLSYTRKREARNLLICSKHFSKHMWVNSNTRLKRLHKNAVPEVNPDDDIDIIAISPASDKKKSGLKIKKVSTLLTESALRESLTPGVKPSHLPLISSIRSEASPKNSVRKWPPLVPRSKQVASTEAEKKLLSENQQLKEELDRNMDYILNQKAHYEGILSKEKEKLEGKEAKIKSLETAQRKLWQTYEVQLQAQKTAFNSKDHGRKEMKTQLKLVQLATEDSERKLEVEKHRAALLQNENEELLLRINELSESRAPTPPPTEPDFTGEKFHLVLREFLDKEAALRERVDSLTLELEQREDPRMQKQQLLNLAADNLNHLQLSWLDSVVNRENSTREFHEHFKELCLSLYEASESAYAICMKVFSLAPLETVKQWAKQATTAAGATTTTNATINALYEEGEPLSINEIVVESRVSCFEAAEAKQSRGKAKDKSERKSPPPLKRKRSYYEADDEYEEGRVSDEDEEIFFSDDSEEEEEGGRGPPPRETFPPERSFVVPIVPTPSSSSSSAPHHAPQQEATQTAEDFDFILENEEEVVGTSMPMLVPGSPMQSLGSASPQLKISNRKKVITSDAALQPGPSKVVFRVIES